MPEKFTRKQSVIFIVASLMFLTGFVRAEAQRIRVVVQNTSIRSEPNPEGDIIGNPPLGSVFEVTQKSGAWYEIKFKSQLGLTMKGYIHAMFVEEMAETPAPKTEEKKTPVKPEPVKTEAKEPAPAKTPTKVTTRPAPRAALSIMGGMTSGSFLNESSSYSSNWSQGILKTVSETGTINHSLDSPIGVGVSFSFLFLSGFGIQIRADSNLKSEFKSDRNKSSYTITWSWTDGSGPYDDTVSWPVSGDMAVIPLSLNLIYKLESGGRFVPYLSLGLSYFSGSFKASTTAGYGFTYIYDVYRRIEYVSMPLSLEVSLDGAGFNVGGGFELRLLPNLALNMDAVFFYRSKIYKSWSVETGTYAGNNFPELALSVDQELADAISENLSLVTINPSFFKFQAGLTFLF